MKEFSTVLLAWHAENARDFPWRDVDDPYRVWVSEIMLQQTRTEAVVEKYLRFIERFPTVQALAAADEEAVLKAWEGLGYYSRARNLHAAARIVALERDGRLPEEAREIQRLPGVGEYTAGAIASIAFGKRELALDGNAVRVFSRVLAEERVMTAPVRRDLARRAALLLPETHAGDFNQAIMGLANLICLPARPACGDCPVSAFCRAREDGLAASLPRMLEKSPRRVEDRAVALILCQGRILARRRPAKGLLAGLWEFPSFLGARTVADLEECLREMDCPARFVRRLPDAQHVFSHVVWRMSGWLFEAARADERFFSREELEALPFPSALAVYRALAREAL